MNQPEILDKNLVVRIPTSFNQYLAEVAKHNNLRPATFSRLILMRHAQNLYQTPINQAAAAFLRQVATQAKKEKAASVTLVAVIKEPE